MLGGIIQLQHQLVPLQHGPTDKDVQTTAELFATPSELYLIHQPPNERVTAAAGLLEHPRQECRPTVNMILHDGAIGEKLILAKFSFAVHMRY